MPRFSVTSTLFLAAYASLNGQPSAGPHKGTLIVDGGGTTNLVKDRFVAIAGGKSARIVVLTYRRLQHPLPRDLLFH